MLSQVLSVVAVLVSLAGVTLTYKAASGANRVQDKAADANIATIATNMLKPVSEQLEAVQEENRELKRSVRKLERENRELKDQQTIDRSEIIRLRDIIEVAGLDQQGE